MSKILVGRRDHLTTLLTRVGPELIDNLRWFWGAFNRKTQKCGGLEAKKWGNIRPRFDNQ
jgi:hypothetical protein